MTCRLKGTPRSGLLSQSSHQESESWALSPARSPPQTTRPHSQPGLPGGARSAAAIHQPGRTLLLFLPRSCWLERPIRPDGRTRCQNSPPVGPVAQTIILLHAKASDQDLLHAGPVLSLFWPGRAMPTEPRARPSGCPDPWHQRGLLETRCPRGAILSLANGQGIYSVKPLLETWEPSTTG